MPFERLDFTEFLPDVPDFLGGPNGLNLAKDVAPLHQSWRELRDAIVLKNYDQTNGLADSFTPDQGGQAFEVVEGIPTDLIGIYYHEGIPSASPTEGTTLAHLTHAGTRTDVSRAAGYASFDGFRFTQYGSAKIIASSLEYPLQIRTGAGAFADVSYSSTAVPQFEFIGRVRSRLVGAYAKDGATYYPHRFWWSDSDDETEWDPVANGPGYADIKTDAGLITGLVCFEEFAILFQENAVHRLTFVGGTTGFQRQQLGSAGDGKDFFVEPAKFGRDVYYFSRGGFKVVRSNGQIEPISEGYTDRFFLDGQKTYAYDPSYSMKSAVSDHWGIVAFYYQLANPTNPGQPVMAFYNIRSGRWSVIDITTSSSTWKTDGFLGPTLTLPYYDMVSYNPPGAGQSPLCPLDDLAFMLTSADGINKWRYSWGRFSDDVTAASYPPRFISRVWEAPDAVRATIKGIRPMWRYNGTLANEPLITITIDYDEAQHLNSAIKAQWSQTTAAANIDQGGFIRTDLPIVGRFFQFTVDIASMPNVTIEEFDGLEIEIEAAGVVG